MKSSLVLAAVLTVALANRGTRTPILPFENPSSPVPQTKIDRLVLKNLKRLGILPAPLCSDAVFVRRVYLDAIGTLPTAQETKDFLSDQNPKKRALLIDRLLERKEFADYWATKWCDLLRVKSEYPINLWPNAVQCYHHWIRTCIKENMPYDRFVREMLTATGSNFDVPPVNFYRAVQSREPTGIAQAVALSFMGVRAESWPKQRWSEMAAFFAQDSLQDHRAVERRDRHVRSRQGLRADRLPSGPAEAVFPDGTPARLLPGQDPREVFADWLIAPKNPWFARAIVNRIWAWLLGRGIIHEPDDIRPNNPPSNPELLAYLERELVAAHYDLKHVFRLILNSNTYQLSSIPETDRPEGDACFSRYLAPPAGGGSADRRHLPGDRHDRKVFQPHSRAVHLHSREPAFHRVGRRQHQQFVSGNVRPPGARYGSGVGAEQSSHGRPTTALVEFEPYPAEDRGKPQAPRVDAIERKPREIVDEIYLTLLSRHATVEELKILRDYAQPGHGGRRPMMDLVWALINSAEFLYRH